MVRLIILMFCVFSLTTGEFVVAGILPGIAADLDVPVGSAGLLVTAYAVGMIVGGPLVTAVTAGIDRKPLMMALLGVAVIGNTASAFVGGFAAVLVVRFLSGLVTSTFFAQAMVVAVRAAPPERAATTVARLAFGMNLAMILGAPIGTLIGRYWGWQATFIAIAIACLIGLTLVWRCISSSTEGVRSSAIGELRVLRRPTVLRALVLTAIGSVGALMVFTYLAPLMIDLGGHPAPRMPVLLLAYGIGATVGNLLGGALYDRNPQLYQPVLLGGLATALFSVWFVADSTSLTVLGMVTIGMLGFAVIPGMQARVMASAADAPTLAMAVNASGYQVAAACAGLVGGRLADSDYGPRAIYVVAAALTLGGTLMTVVSTRIEQLSVEPSTPPPPRGTRRSPRGR